MGTLWAPRLKSKTVSGYIGLIVGVGALWANRFNSKAVFGYSGRVAGALWAHRIDSERVYGNSAMVCVGALWAPFRPMGPTPERLKARALFGPFGSTRKQFLHIVAASWAHSRRTFGPSVQLLNGFKDLVDAPWAYVGPIDDRCCSKTVSGCGGRIVGALPHFGPIGSTRDSGRMFGPSAQFQNGSWTSCTQSGR